MLAPLFEPQSGQGKLRKRCADFGNAKCDAERQQKSGETKYDDNE